MLAKLEGRDLPDIHASTLLEVSQKDRKTTMKKRDAKAADKVADDRKYDALTIQLKNARKVRPVETKRSEA